MLDTIQQLDLRLFFKINGQWTNGFFDVLMPWLRQPSAWAPLYLFLILFTLINFRWRGLAWIIFFLISFGIADQTSMFFKDFFGRIRPCRDPNLEHYVRVLAYYCPKSGSFTSSHAANHFAVGVFSFFSLKPFIGKYSWLFIIWAASICYAQVYVGVHYPGDVLGGAVLGTLIGSLTANVFQRRIGLQLEPLI
ncbi:hypothetical protein COR50_10620 [Chitinophaga caeni]|uniref:Phosphatidic acid phosphatase type 2/haloperoxidase domain-containing protein n=1 Tax=Chitinophaga caeni TaxID=2029983 RepID=A0A291QUR2_9BACT|nr:phosphatase PAP2 family protein [Chitinophaga caeni]ATL47584.1 hypothetical protein COR50_10620 [Chitinophaga caeni]